MLEVALQALPVSDSPSRARLLARQCGELAFGSLERRVELGREAKACASRIGDDATLLEVLVDVANALRIPAMLDENLDDAREAVRIADDLADPSGRCLAAAQGVTDGMRAADFEFAHEQLSALMESAERLRQPVWLWAAAFEGAEVAMAQGDPLRAEELATKAMEIATASGQPDAFSFYGTQLMEIRFQQGRMGELAELVAQIADEYPGIPTYRAVLAKAYLEAGDETSARQLVDEATAQGFDLPMDTAWLDGIVIYSWPAIELRIAPAARPLYELLLPFHDQVPCNPLVPHEPVAMFLGGLAAVLGRFDEAETYFERAAELNRLGEMRFAEANTNLLWGRMLVERNGTGNADRARILLERARDSAASRGYTMIERRAVIALSKIA